MYELLLKTQLILCKIKDNLFYEELKLKDFLIFYQSYILLLNISLFLDFKISFIKYFESTVKAFVVTPPKWLKFLQFWEGGYDKG